MKTLPEFPTGVVEAGPMRLRGALEPDTFDEKTGEIDVVFSTGERVLAEGYVGGQWRRFYEELEISETACDLSRLNARAPVLDSHQKHELAKVIGVVVPGTARIVGPREARARLKLSRRASIAELRQDIADGIVAGISAGFYVARYQNISTPDDEIPVLRAIKWTPHEISFIAIQADAGASARAAPDTYACEIVRGETDPMTPTPKNNGQNPQTSETPAVEPTGGERERAAAPAGAAVIETAPDATAAIAAERKRGLEIHKAVRSAKLSTEFAEDLVTRGLSLEAAKGVNLDKLAEASASTAVDTAQTTTRERGDTPAAIERALLVRLRTRGDDGKDLELTEQARQYRGMSLLEIGRAYMEDNGARTRGLSRDELARATMRFRGPVVERQIRERGTGMAGTSDFAAIVENVANKRLRMAYQAAPQTWLPLGKRSDAPDFKPVSRVQIGELAMSRLNEHGEFRRVNPSEAKEAYSLFTSGAIFALTRRLWVNDDLSAFSRIVDKFGDAAAQLMSDEMWKLITTPQTMGDGVALFHAATHGNLLTGGGSALGLTGLGAARAQMMKQTGLNGVKLTILPRMLIVPVALGMTAQQVTGQNFPDAPSNFNPFRSGNAWAFDKIIEEPRLDEAAGGTTAWYLAASPNQVDLIEYAFLDGNDGPVVETREAWETDGMEFRGKLDFGGSFLDHRGIQKNAGV
jgi:phage head maturation protease